MNVTLKPDLAFIQGLADKIKEGITAVFSFLAPMLGAGQTPAATSTLQ